MSKRRKNIKNYLTKILGANMKKNWYDKLNCLEIAIHFTKANNVVGDYFEFGVLGGKSFLYAYSCFKNLGKKVRMFAFDSFEGCPEVNDDDIPEHWRKGGFMVCPKKEFINNIRTHGVSVDDGVIIIEGFYKDSLVADLSVKYNIKKVSVVHVDCDLYESTVEVLDFITPFIQDGTVLVFDDFFYYKGHPNKGERGAFNQWLNKNLCFVATELCKIYPAAAYIINEVEEK